MPARMLTAPILGMAGLLLTDGIAGPGPLGEIGKIAQMGVAGVVLVMWFIERKERTERQMKDDDRYEKLQEKLLMALQSPVRCPYQEDVRPPGRRR